MCTDNLNHDHQPLQQNHVHPIYLQLPTSTQYRISLCLLFPSLMVSRLSNPLADGYSFKQLRDQEIQILFEMCRCEAKGLRSWWTTKPPLFWLIEYLLSDHIKHLLRLTTKHKNLSWLSWHSLTCLLLQKRKINMQGPVCSSLTSLFI